MVKAIHNLIYKSWQNGSVQADLKIAAVKVLKKPGKKIITKHLHIDLLAWLVVWENAKKDYCHHTDAFAEHNKCLMRNKRDSGSTEVQP